MRKILTTLALAFSLVASAKPAELVVLTPENTLNLFGEVNEQMVERVATTLPKLGNTVYVNLVSPGGSIIAGKRIIDQLSAASNSGKKIVCIPHLAVSMAFVILQSEACPHRLALPSSVLMQHQPSVGFEGPLRSVANQFDAARAEILEIEAMQAKRLKITVDKYRELTNFEWWLNTGTISLNAKAVDSIGNVICSPALLKRKRIDEVQFFMTTIKIESSECPYVLRQKVILPERPQNKTLQIRY